MPPDQQQQQDNGQQDNSSKDQQQQDNSQQSQQNNIQQGQQGGLDQKSYASLMQSVGENKIKKELAAIFGTDDFGELKSFAEKIKTADTGKTQNPDEVVKRISELESKISQKEIEHKREIQRVRLATELAKHSPKIPDLILKHFEDQFEVKVIEGNEVVFKKGSSIPEQIGTDIATVPKFFENWAKKSELSSLFNSTQIPGQHVDTSGGGYVDEKNYPVTPEQRRDPDFYEAIEKSGQMTAYIATGKVDMTKVRPLLKKKQ